MLARSRRITLGGIEIETPLLVPAISSKALGPVELGLGANKSPHVIPASQVHTDILIPRISEAVLLSAYDIHHRFIADAGAFQKGFRSSTYARIKVIFIDSGWYEKSVGLVSGQWYHEVGGQSLPFEIEDYIRLIDKLDSHVPAVLVSWDAPATAKVRPGGRPDRQRPTYYGQIEAAQDFFGARIRFSSNLILKPPRTRRYHKFAELAEADAARLRAFDVVGVTEKELGESLRDRLTSLAHLRTVMDKADATAPIHVFGGLDPLITPLYVAVGAEIFDGLSWLRYGFRDGLSVSAENASLLEHASSRRFEESVSHMQLNNLSALEQLVDELKVFIDKGCDWSKLRHGEHDLRPAYEAFEAAQGSGTYGR